MKKALFAASLAGALLLSPAPQALAKQRTVIEQIRPDLVDASYVNAVRVTVADTATKKMAGLEEKATEKRAAANLPPYTPAEDGQETAVPPAEQYATLPFAAMAPLVIRDVTRKWGLTPERGKPVDLDITIENIKTADAAMAMLLASSDELSGEVVVRDPATGEQVGNFYVQVVNGHSGLMGMAMRGAGVREKLVEEFALESARVLTGSTKKDWKKRVKAAKAEANSEKP